MPGNKYNRIAPTPSRVERLLKDRELRRNRTFHPNEEGSDSNRELDPFELDLSLREGNNWGSPREEELLGSTLSANRTLYEGCESEDGKLSKQRLLVVANRLPVSAVRRGEDSWALEVSAGGLVTALLGKYKLTS